MAIQETSSRKRGRPSKADQEIKAAAVPTPSAPTGDFRSIIAPYKKDPVVRALVNARRALFNSGESLDDVTALTLKRVKVLQARGAMH